jgi:Winged helix-turn helix
LIDLARWLFEEFRLEISKQTLSRELRNMGFRKLSARPRHHAQDEEAAAAFKKTYDPPRLQAILRSGLVSLRQRIRSQDHRPGQDGDPRVLVLINFAVSTHQILNQGSRTPVDCQAISLPPPANIAGFRVS